MWRLKKMFIGLLVLIVVLIVVFSFFNNKKNTDMIFGTTFNPHYARFLGLDSGHVYKTILDDWKFRNIRLSSQWSEVEKNRGKYDFSELDWLMNEADKRNAKVILAVGRKTPRWPECHLPDWAKKMKYDDYKTDLLKYMEAVVNRYRDHSALEMWQVENEPFLAFGLCKTMPRKDLVVEVDLVKKLDPNHKIIVTDSGELSTWRKTIKAGDLFGTTMYRVVWNKYVGYFSYDWLPAVFYRAKVKVFRRDLNTAYVIELQAEPWMPDNAHEKGVDLKEQFKSMDLDRLKKNTDFAMRTGMPRAYLWGSEWWYWLKEKQNRPEFVDYVKTLKKK